MTINVNKTIKLDAYAIIRRAVTEGVEYGYNRAFKHTDTPSREAIIAAIDHEVMLKLGEVISWDI